MRVHFTRHGALLEESFGSSSTNRSGDICPIPLKKRFMLDSTLMQASKNPRELTLLQNVETCAGEIDILTARAAGLGCDIKGTDVSGETLEDHLQALQKQLDFLQQQKQMLLIFAETNLATAEELSTVSVCFFVSCS